MYSRAARFGVLYVLVLAVFVSWWGAAAAQIPRLLSYQGYLTSAAGVPLTGAVNVTFSLYTDQSTGGPLYTETQSIAVDNGLFSASIGAVTPLNGVQFDVPYYLGIKVDGDPSELVPRQPVRTSPYALRAVTAETLAASATVAGSQIAAGTVGTAQLSDNAVTQAKLSPTTGAAAGKVLGTDGANLQWQTAGNGTG